MLVRCGAGECAIFATTPNSLRAMPVSTASRYAENESVKWGKLERIRASLGVLKQFLVITALPENLVSALGEPHPVAGYIVQELSCAEAAGFVIPGI